MLEIDRLWDSAVLDQNSKKIEVIRKKISRKKDSTRYLYPGNICVLNQQKWCCFVQEIRLFNENQCVVNTSGNDRTCCFPHVMPRKNVYKIYCLH